MAADAILVVHAAFVLFVVLALAGGLTWSIVNHVPPFFLLPLLVFGLARRRGFAFGQSRPNRRRPRRP